MAITPDKVEEFVKDEAKYAWDFYKEKPAVQVALQKL
jgi:hypothetical protein